MFLRIASTESQSYGIYRNPDYTTVESVEVYPG